MKKKNKKEQKIIETEDATIDENQKIDVTNYRKKLDKSNINIYLNY